MSETAQVAVIPEKKAPIKFSATKVIIAKAAKKWKKVPDMATKEGYADAQQAKRELTPLRTALTKEMELQKEAAQTHIKKINAKGGELVALVQAIEKPIYDAKKAHDEKVAKDKADAILREENRIADIQEMIADIDGLTAGLLNADVATIEHRLIAANKITITGKEYMEFVEAASVALSQVKDQLGAGVESAKALAAQQKDIDNRQAEQDKRESLSKINAEIALIKMVPVDMMGSATAEMKSKYTELDNQLDELNELGAAGSFGELVDDARDAIINSMISLNGMIDHQKNLDDQQKILDEKQQKLDDDAAAETQRKIDEQKAIDDAAQEKLEADELAARMPEDMKLRGFMDSLLAVEPPDVENLHSVAVLRDLMLALSDINKMVYDGTQSPADEEDAA